MADGHHQLSDADSQAVGTRLRRKEQSSPSSSWLWEKSKYKESDVETIAIGWWHHMGALTLPGFVDFRGKQSPLYDMIGDQDTHWKCRFWVYLISFTWTCVMHSWGLCLILPQTSCVTLDESFDLIEDLLLCLLRGAGMWASCEDRQVYPHELSTHL